MDITVNKVEKSRIHQLDPSNIQFGKLYADHMLVAHYEDGEWKQPGIMPFSNLSLSPATTFMHYGQAIFEGVKAYKDPEGNPTIFRPHDNWKRFNRSAERMAMPDVPEELFVEGMRQLVSLDLRVDRDAEHVGVLGERLDLGRLDGERQRVDPGVVPQRLFPLLRQPLTQPAAGTVAIADDDLRIATALEACGKRLVDPRSLWSLGLGGARQQGRKDGNDDGETREMHAQPLSKGAAVWDASVSGRFFDQVSPRRPCRRNVAGGWNPDTRGIPKETVQTSVSDFRPRDPGYRHSFERLKAF